MTWLPELPRTEAGFIIATVALVIGGSMALALARTRGGAVAGIVLIAMTPLVPTLPTPLGLGLSSDDVLPVLGIGILVANLARAGAIRLAPPSGTRLVLFIGLALLVASGAVAAILNGSQTPEALRLFMKGSGRFAFLGLIVWVVGMTVTRQPGLKVTAARGLAWMGSAEAAFGLVAYVVPLPGRLGLSPTRPWSVLGGEVPGRIAGTLGISPNFTGAILMVTVIVTVGLAIRSEGRVRAVWLACALIQLIALALTFSRAPLGLGLVGVVILLLLTSRPILLIPVAVTAAVVAAFTPLVGRYLSDATDRLALWSAAFRVMQDHPLGGVGPGNLAATVRADPERYGNTLFGTAHNNAHNTVLLAGAEMGILAGIGALIVNVALGAMALLTARNALTGRPRDELRVAGAIAVLAVLGQGMVNNLFTVAVTSVILGLLVGAFLWPRNDQARRPA